MVKGDKKENKDPRILIGEKAQRRYEELKSKGLIIYECIVGSTSYGTNLPTSDVDKKFIYIETLDHMLDGNYSLQLNLTDDYVGYELGRYLELLGKQNPNIIELLHADEKFVEHCHPLFKEIIVVNKDRFLSKKVAFSFGSYAKTQIDKAQGTNKKFMNPMDGPRKSLFDFAWIPFEQGSITLRQWLNENVIPIEWVGLSAIPHMRYTYHLFVDPVYDNVFDSSKKEFNKQRKWHKRLFDTAYSEDEIMTFKSLLHSNIGEYFGGNGMTYRSKYNGAIDKDGVQPKLSSIPKDAKPLKIVHFNMDGFQKYCDDYKEYHDWLEKRNLQRFVENASNEHNYDRKNMMHCHRLLDMCIEILSGQGVNVYRPNREELLGIRHGNNTYKELVDRANDKIKKIDELFKTSDLPEETDQEFITGILLDFRRHFYNI